MLAPQSHYARSDITASTNAGAAGARAPSSSMGDLIDLEQQAEFYRRPGPGGRRHRTARGAHLRRRGGATPLPYLQLLEIHRRRGDRGAYEAVARGVRGRFDDRAPEWSADLTSGRSLSDYPQTIARLQALWPTPMHAMQSLDSLCWSGARGDDAFDYPAYRELLFLYSIARDLAGNVETDFGPIDLLLPLEDALERADASSGGRLRGRPRRLRLAGRRGANGR